MLSLKHRKDNTASLVRKLGFIDKDDDLSQDDSPRMLRDSGSEVNGRGGDAVSSSSSDQNLNLENNEEESNETMRLKMLNGERIKTKGSIYDSFTSTQQKEIVKMK